MPTEGLDQSGQMAVPRPTHCTEGRGKDGANYPYYWGQDTERHPNTGRPINDWASRVGNNGEIFRGVKSGGRSQRAHTTCPPLRDLAIGKHLANAK